jgi:hypothetical protein
MPNRANTQSPIAMASAGKAGRYGSIVYGIKLIENASIKI